MTAVIPSHVISKETDLKRSFLFLSTSQVCLLERLQAMSKETDLERSLSPLPFHIASLLARETPRRSRSVASADSETAEQAESSKTPSKAGAEPPILEGAALWASPTVTQQSNSALFQSHGFTAPPRRSLLSAPSSPTSEWISKRRTSRTN